MSVSVLLVEDVPELRSVIRHALHLRGGLRVVAEASNGAEAVAAAAAHQPDIVVLDVGLPDLAGTEVLTRIRAVSVASQVVVYSGSYRAEDLGEPVAAYVSKDHDVAYLVDLLANLDRPRYPSVSVRIGPDPVGIGAARRLLLELCRQASCEAIVDDALLVATELVTNALIHAGPVCEFRAVLSEAVLRLQVIDTGAGMPDPRTARQTDEGGRGLLLISALSAAWGTVALPTEGKVVWAELRRDPDQGRHGDDERMSRTTDVCQPIPLAEAPPGQEAWEGERRRPLALVG